MSLLAHLQGWFLAHFSQPAADRVLHRAIRKHRCRTILEFNIGDASRAERFIQLAALGARGARVTYSAIDAFELRLETDGDALSLKLAYRKLRTADARIRLLPGEPFEVLARSANSLGPQDLIVFNGLTPESMARGWFYLPRLLHAKTLVFERAESGDGVWTPVTQAEVESRARRSEVMRRRAA